MRQNCPSKASGHIGTSPYLRRLGTPTATSDLPREPLGVRRGGLAQNAPEVPDEVRLVGVAEVDRGLGPARPLTRLGVVGHPLGCQVQATALEHPPWSDAHVGPE